MYLWVKKKKSETEILKAKRMLQQIGASRGKAKFGILRISLNVRIRHSLWQANASQAHERICKSMNELWLVVLGENLLFLYVIVQLSSFILCLRVDYDGRRDLVKAVLARQGFFLQLRHALHTVMCTKRAKRWSKCFTSSVFLLYWSNW